MKIVTAARLDPSPENLYSLDLPSEVLNPDILLTTAKRQTRTPRNMFKRTGYRKARFWPRLEGNRFWSRPPIRTPPPITSTPSTLPPRFSSSFGVDRDHTLVGPLWEGSTRAEDAQGTPNQSHISPSIRVYEGRHSRPFGLLPGESPLPRPCLRSPNLVLTIFSLLRVLGSWSGFGGVG